MVRFILLGALFGSLALIAYVFSENPDWSASFEVFGYRLTLHLGFVFFGLMIAFWLFGWLYFAVRRTLAMPAEMAKNARISRQNRGYAALERGIVALAAGDPDEADRQARRAQKLLEETAGTMLLTAHAAQLNGDEESAAKYFEEMTKNEETAFLGLRGKTMQALARGDRKEVQSLLERARKIKPNIPWLLESQLFLLETDAAFQAAEKGAWWQAADHANRALSDDPAFFPARSLAARANLEVGNKRQAIQHAVEAWRLRPTAGVATTYLRAFNPKTIAAKRAAIVELIKANPDAWFSQYLLVEAAIESGEFVIANDVIGDLPKTSFAVGVNALKLRLQNLETHGIDRSPTALDGHSLPVEPQVCSNCGAEHTRWRAYCTGCGEFNAIISPLSFVRGDPDDGIGGTGIEEGIGGTGLKETID